MPGVELPQWSGFRREASEVTDKMDDKEAAGDLVILGFELVTVTLHQIFLDYDFVVRSQNAERLFDDVPVGLKKVSRLGRHFVKLVTDSRNEDNTPGFHRLGYHRVIHLVAGFQRVMSDST
jgi:hypothetical protein